MTDLVVDVASFAGAERTEILRELVTRQKWDTARPKVLDLGIEASVEVGHTLVVTASQGFKVPPGLDLFINIVHRGKSALKITEDMDATGLAVFVAPTLIRLKIVGHRVINLTVEEQIKAFISILL
jgi:hypothetical protein